MTAKTETEYKLLASTVEDERNLYTPALFSGLEIVRDSVQTLPKTASGHGYKYTPLDEVLNYIRPILKKAGLIMFQQTETDIADRVGVCTTILAKDGGHITSSVYAPKPYENKTTTVEANGNKTVTTVKDISQMSAIQRAGCEITYLRRYSLAAVLGLASDEDKDGYSYNPTDEERRQGRIQKLTALLTSAKREAEIPSLADKTDDELVALYKELHG